MPRRAKTDKRPTMDTVAERLGVSRMTVSNAYNRPDQISAATREKVLAAASEVGYPGPNPVARGLTRGRTGSIGLIYDAPLRYAFTDPAAVQLLEGVSEWCEAHASGLSLIPKLAEGSAELISSAMVDGFVGYCYGHDERLDALRGRGLPFTLIDEDEGHAERQVNVADRDGARAAAQHLVDLGHRRFGVAVPWAVPSLTVGGVAGAPGVYHPTRERLAGWGDACRAAGVDWDAVPLRSGPEERRSTGATAAHALLTLPERPTAILALTDLMALGVLDAAAKLGLRVPQELSVVGFDDIPEAASSNPPLTTVHQPHRDKGRIAAELLELPAPVSRMLPTELVVSGSTAPPPA